MRCVFLQSIVYDNLPIRFFIIKSSLLVIDIAGWKNQHRDAVNPIYQAGAIQFDGTSLTEPLNMMAYIEWTSADFSTVATPPITGMSTSGNPITGMSKSGSPISGMTK